MSAAYAARTLRRAKLRRRPTPKNEWGARLSSITSIGSNLVIGMASVTIAGASLYFTIEFNKYQRIQNERTAIQEEITSCVSRAQLVVELIRSRSDLDAINIIQESSIYSKHCNAHGINLSDMTAKMILKNHANIANSVVKRARQRISRQDNKSLYSQDAYNDALNSLREHQQSASPFPVTSAINELDLAPPVVFPGFTKRYTESSPVSECDLKLQELMRSKPEEQSWTITCADGSVRGATSF